MTANRPEFVVAVYAISKLDAAAVLISPAWKAREVGHALERDWRRLRDRRCRHGAAAGRGARPGRRFYDLDAAPLLGRRSRGFGHRARPRTGARERRGGPRLQLRDDRAAEGGSPHARVHRCRRPATGSRRLGSARTTASRSPRRRRTSSGCSTCSPRPRPARRCGCIAASTSTRSCAASPRSG